MSALPDHAVVLHPGPMNRGLEISAEVADGTRSAIVEQVANGVSIRMAVLYLLLGGNESALGGHAGDSGGREAGTKDGMSNKDSAAKDGGTKDKVAA
jgi:aspartate carbamoyltransferase catalytic subunit